MLTLLTVRSECRAAKPSLDPPSIAYIQHHSTVDRTSTDSLTGLTSPHVGPELQLHEWHCKP